jgi:drug/metabolite transporter (DMT)-like permease
MARGTLARAGIAALLAYKLLHERLHKFQYLGIFFAISGIVIISLG